MPGESKKSREELLAELQTARERIAELEACAPPRTMAFDGLLDNLADPIFIKDARHRWVYFNQAFLDLVGLTAGQALGKSDEVLFSSQEVTFIRAADDTVLQSGESLVVEEELVLRGVPHCLRTVKSFWRDPISNEPLVLGVIHDITEHVKALRALEQSERRLLRERETFEVIYDGSLDAVLLTRADATFFMVNRAAEQLTGYTRQELLDMNIADLHDDEVIRAFGDNLERVMAGEVVVTTIPLRRRDGTRADVEFRSSRVCIGGEEYVHTVARDVSKRLQAEAALRASEEKHHALSAATFEALFITENGFCVETNHAASEMFGYSYGELLGMFPTDMVTEETRHLVFQRITLGGEEPYEAVGLRKDGTQFPAQFQGRMFRYRGRPVRVTAVRDLTGQKRAEQELAESEHKYRLLAENVEDVIFRTDEQLRFNYVSPSVQRLLGMAPEEIEGCEVGRMLTPESMGRVLEAREQRLRAEAEGNPSLVNRMELEMFREDGSTVWVEVITKGLRDARGLRHGLVGLARNIAERKRMERQLLTAKESAEAASKAKSEFLANVSHEIRTPLNGMLGMLQLLQENNLCGENAEMVGTALDCGRGLVMLINDILDLSQIEAGVVRLHPRAFDLDKTLGSVLAVFAHQATSRGLALGCDLTPGTPLRLFGDEGRLRQVLFNLVGNAMKFTERGEVRMSVCPLPQVRTDGKVRLLFSVRDTGIGIPENRINDVFENFTQVDGSYTRRYNGVGLGLSIVRRLVRLMGGGLVLDSEEGGGTEICFSLLFDVLEPSEESSGESGGKPGGKENGIAQSGSDPAKLGGLRVLLAEDDRVGSVAVKSMVERLGHTCTAVASGGEAVDALLGGQWDCVLMDIQMPDMNGLEAVRLARERLPAGQSLPPVVALTAHAMSGDREAFLAAGMDDYLAKPVDMDALQELLKGLGRR
ncbi:MAG: PAS domain S-box protein [Desulfovibrio sp.]